MAQLIDGWRVTASGWNEGDGDKSRSYIATRLIDGGETQVRSGTVTRSRKLTDEHFWTAVVADIGAQEADAG